MNHRHLNHDELTPAAIDDVIARGRLADWVRLRRLLLADHSVRSLVLRICAAYAADPYAQRYHFWKRYAERQPA